MTIILLINIMWLMIECVYEIYDVCNITIQRSEIFVLKAWIHMSNISVIMVIVMTIVHMSS